MTFYRSPFLFIAPLVIAGILVSDLGNVLIMWSLVVVQALILFASFFKKSLASVAIGLGFVLFGQLLMEVNKDTDLAVFSGSHNTFLVEVLEEGKRESNWKKNIVKVIGKVNENHVLELDSKLLLFSKELIEEGDVLLTTLRIDPIDNKGNPGEFNAKAYWHSKNIHNIAFLSNDDFVKLSNKRVSGLGYWFRARRASFASILEEYLKGDELALAKALILGDKTLLSQEIRNTFSTAGAMHVLAVSGLHVGLVMLILNFIFGKFTRWISRGSALIITVLISWFFAGITGFPPSVVRSVIMFSILLTGQLIGRKGSGMNSLGFAALMLLAYDPFLVFDLGFQLSFLAMLGILTLYDPISRIIYIKNKWLLRIWQTTAVGISAQFMTLPLILYHFHQFPNYFWLSNLGVFMLAGILLGNGLVLIILGRAPFIAGLIGALLSVGLSLLITFMQWVEALPWSVARGFELPVVWVIICYIVLFGVIFFKKKKALTFITPLVAGIVLFTQFIRFQNLNSDHILFFNSNFPLIAIRSGGDALFLYEGKGNRAKVDRFVGDYEKIHPSNCKIQLMDRGIHHVSLINKREVIIDNGARQILINAPNKHIQLIKRLPLLDDKLELDKVLFMPYLQSDGGFELKKGSINIDLD